jgi:glycosyltransferase involved in cell wall biosynthesis
VRILSVSGADVQGGAERVAWNLFAAYRTRGLDSTLAVGVKRSDDPDVVEIRNDAARSAWSRTLRGLSERLRREGAETLPSRVAGVLAEPRRRAERFLGIEDFHHPGAAALLRSMRRPDIVHLHNLHGDYFDLRLLPSLGGRMPVVLTMHDAWLLSGHCAHSFGCERWADGCGRCPDLRIYPAVERDATAYNWRRKRDIFARSRVFVATPSRWLAERVGRSMLQPAVVEARVIPNGIDLEVFRPGDQGLARDRLGIPRDATVLMTLGVRPRTSPWRDLDLLRGAVSLAHRSELERQTLLLVVGDAGPSERLDGVEVRYEPPRSDPTEVAWLYRAADLYVHPARVDTFPTSVLEALATGTPVVATEVGGIPEQVDHGETGLLVGAGDAGAMARAIGDLLADGGLRGSMRERAATRARERFSLERQVDSYLGWYAEILEAYATSPARRVG